MTKSEIEEAVAWFERESLSIEATMDRCKYAGYAEAVYNQYATHFVMYERAIAALEAIKEGE